MRRFSPRIRQGYPNSTTAMLKNWLPGGNPLIYVNEVLADTPWAYWRLGETSGTTALDISGNARNATYTNSPTLGANPLITVDNSVDLDGTNDYASFTPGTAVTGNFTYECWINADSFSSFPGLVSGWNANSSGNYGSIILLADTGVVEIYAANSTFTGWSYTDSTGYTLSTGTTYHLVFVNDDTNNTAKLYVNGVEQYSSSGKTTAMGMVNASKILSIGRATTSNYFNGRIDEVAIYTKALSADRILTHYRAGVNGVNPFLGSLAIEYLTVAGGGGGGFRAGGGGGAGGVKTDTASLTYSTPYTITVGAGGLGTTDSSGTVNGANGSNSSISGSGLTTVTSTGGGGGASNNVETGSNGGSGGGGSSGNVINVGVYGQGGTGISGQGRDGGDGSYGNDADDYAGGGGGGAGAVGGDTRTQGGPNAGGGNGGVGVATSITGTSVTYGGGGGGGMSASSSAVAATGGTGGGGAGSKNGAAGNGTANTGGGGGGGGFSGATNYTTGNGGSGVIILRWLISDGTITIGAGLTASSSTDGLYSVTTITAGTGNVSWS